METCTTPRIALSAPQTQALVSLLCTIGTYQTIDLREVEALGVSAVRVTVWRSGEPTSWQLEADGGTYEAA